LLAERDGEWDTSEVPQLYFNRVEKAIQGLSRAGINSDLNKRRDMALYYLKALGEFDAAVRDWENRPAGQKTWQSIKTFISAEHAKENKQNKLTAKNFKANMIEEQAEATEELIAALTEKHTQQIENLIKSNTEAMKQMISLIKNNKKEPGDKQQPDEEKKKKREERRQRFNDAPICKHCGKKHPTKKEDECWELETNNASRPANWKSSKST
jgi:protein-tyrosine-phosphatase